VALRVTDSLSGTDRIESTITVADTMPPDLRLVASPAILWPPNHRMIPVHLTWTAMDACTGDMPVRLVGILSSEPDDAPGGGDRETTGDIAGLDPGTPDDAVLLRAERITGGPGRTYTIRYAAADAAGHSTTRDVIVTVPGRDRPGASRRASSPARPER